MALNCISGWKECQESLFSDLCDEAPSFVGRMGGSDTDALVARIDGERTNKEIGRQNAIAHLPRVRRFNGYYDHSPDIEKYLAFLDLLQSTYLACDRLTFVDAKLLSLYFPGNLHPSHRLAKIEHEEAFKALVNRIDAAQSHWSAYPYTFFQTLKGPYNLFRVFEKSLIGKKILVATPFGASIKANLPNRKNFFPDFSYPDFDVKILDTPITYDGLPKEMYPHQNWFETLEALKDQMGRLDFDLALLSCGSYSMPLGIHARDVMSKKAIYVGGILQLFFGIMGRRYENPFFLDAINQSSFAPPIERGQFLAQLPKDQDAPREAFGAYF